MTTEELLKPRYKVIAPYPHMELDQVGVGDIVSPFGMGFMYPDKVKEMYDTYPHLFKPLEWWQDRNQKDLPEYVRFYEPIPLRYSIKKITKWEIGKEMCIVTTNVDIVRKQLSRADQPATEVEYQSFIQR